MVLEYREDSTKGTLVIVSSERAKRPSVHGKKAKKVCPFCKGSEYMTPLTTFAIAGEGGWKVRSFQNRFPVVRPPHNHEHFEPHDPNKPFWRTFGFGEHEVIVETDEHGKQFQDLSEKEIMYCLAAYKNRFAALQKKKGIKCVFLFKNHGPKAGASIDHEHAQIIALPVIPPIVAAESRFVKKTFKKGKCWFCTNDDYLERHPERELIETSHFVAFCPTFARFPYEAWVIPKRHVRTFLEFTPEEDKQLMKILQKIVRAVHDAASTDYILVFHNAAKGRDMHFHVEISPRPNVWAGVELGAGIVINPESGEDAVKALRKAMR
ncbi:DUF4931 domain-containing protein [Candidatus Micrarchaeota archaeon]|nr:DUF4931 domain-containing protein [Candidatus Micrarchaeota archaeon]